MTKNKKKIIIIDGNAIIHRSFHALPDSLTTKDGKLINACYGFMLVFLSVINEIKPDYAIATFDKKAKNFRHDLFNNYKAKRIKAPDELYYQIPMVKKILKAFNVPIFAKNGYEADDIIGTIAKEISKNHKNNIDSYIVTGDMDTLQLVNDNTKVYTLRKGTKDTVIYDHQGVIDKLDVKPDQIIDYKALAGDSSDNIPGIAGIGAKTASKLLNEFNSLDNIYKNLDKLPKNLAKKLKEYKKDAYLSQKLATIVKDAPIDLSLENAIFGNYDKNKVKKILEKFEFNTLVKRLDLDSGEKEKTKINSKKISYKFIIIRKKNELKNFLTKIKKTKECVISFYERPIPKLLEKSVFDCELKYVIVSDALQKEIFLIDLKNIDLKSILKEIKNKKLINFSFKQEFEILINNGFIQKQELNKIKYQDLKIINYLLNNEQDTKKLDELLFKNSDNYQKLIKNKKGQTKLLFEENEETNKKNLEDFLLERTGILKTEYIKKKKEITIISEFQKEKGIFPNPKIKDNQYNLNFVLNQIELPLIKVLIEMELTGINVDKNVLNKLKKEFQTIINEIKNEIIKFAGKDFNIDSTQQLSTVLFEDLNIPTDGIKKGKSGYYTTSHDTLIKLGKKYPIAKLLIQYRELSKLLNTYILPLPKLINQNTNRIHTGFNQTITATGRLSSSNPNLQNIPIRTKYGAKIRKAFVAKKNYSLVSIDYSQIELRLAAHYSKDETMLNVFKNNGDIHTETAAKIHGMKTKEITNEIRRTAKELNFGLIYGMGVYGFAQAANLSRKEAQDFIEKYKNQFPKMFEYLEEAKEIAKDKGYVETLFGRRRYVPQINSSNFMIKSNAERMAVNMPLQGTAADIMKLSMIKVYDYLIKNKLINQIKIISSVHDEILFEIENQYVDKKGENNFDYLKQIKILMESVVKLQIPLKTDIKTGQNWGEMKDLKI